MFLHRHDPSHPGEALDARFGDRRASGARIVGALGASALLVGLLAGCTGDAQTPIQSGSVVPTSADDGSSQTPTMEPTQTAPSETATPAT